MIPAFLVSTTPREIEARWVHEGDQIAVLAKGYEQAHEILPVRTADLAKLDDIVQWWTITRRPEHLDRTLTRTPVAAKFPLTGFRLTIIPPDTASMSTADAAPVPVELYAGDHEQIVIREQVKVEPWDIECRGLDGDCYLPGGHAGDHDPLTGDIPTPERYGDTAL